MKRSFQLDGCRGADNLVDINQISVGLGTHFRVVGIPCEVVVNNYSPISVVAQYDHATAISLIVYCGGSGWVQVVLFCYS